MRRKSALPWWGYVAWIVLLICEVWAWPHLPSRVATHFGTDGEPNGYSSRMVAVVLLPAITTAIMALWHVIWRIDPKRDRYVYFWPTYRFVGGALTWLMVLIQLWLLARAVGFLGLGSQRVMMTLVSVFIVVLANLLPRVQPNWLVGVRTPWTLSSEESWVRTHRLAGNLGVPLGCLMILLTWLLPTTWIGVTIAVPILLWAAAIVVASYFYANPRGRR